MEDLRGKIDNADKVITVILGKAAKTDNRVINIIEIHPPEAVKRKINLPE
jgi:hypothetical protein